MLQSEQDQEKKESQGLVRILTRFEFLPSRELQLLRLSSWGIVSLWCERMKIAVDMKCALGMLFHYDVMMPPCESNDHAPKEAHTALTGFGTVLPGLSSVAGIPAHWNGVGGICHFHLVLVAERGVPEL